MNSGKSILFVSHDVNRAGAQLFIFNTMMHLKKNGHQIVLLSKATWGSMVADFENEFPVFYLEKKYKKNNFSKNQTCIEYLKSTFKFDLIYVNTIACVDLLRPLKTAFNLPMISHIHELKYSIQQYGPKNAEEDLFNFSDKIIACSQAVKDNLAIHGDEKKIVLVHSFVNNELTLNKIAQTDKLAILAKYNIPKDKVLIGACGNADWRKAPDLFIQIARKVLILIPNACFVWIGIDLQSEIGIQISFDLGKLGIEKQVILIAPNPDAVEIISCLSMFLVSSREDPFPLVMLEAALAEKPIVGFEQSGGVSEFVEKDAGFISPYLNLEDIAEKICSLIDSESLRNSLGKRAKAKVLELYSFDNSIKKIESVLGF
jgi:glycosyltransferase involved in cell wall biosynthesis